MRTPALVSQARHLIIAGVLASCVANLQAAPELAAVEPTPGTTVADLIELRVTFTAAVSGVDASDLLVNSIAAAAVSGLEAGPYVFTFTRPPAGDVSVSFDFDHGIAAVDGSGAFVPADGWRYQLVDTIAPTVGVVLSSDGSQPAIEPLPGATVATLGESRVTFSEPVTGIDAGDLLIGGVAAAGVTGSGAGPYVFTFAAPATGATAFSWSPDAGVSDAAGNAFVPEGAGWSVVFDDGTRPALHLAEFSAANATGPKDEDGDTPDWLEIHNPGPGAVDLAGWSLTKDPAAPAMWVFPSVVVDAGARLVVFASGKDRKANGNALHTNFSIDLSGGYLGLFGPEVPRAAVHAFVDYPEQPYDVSFGLNTAGDSRFFSDPTPGEANSADGLLNVATQPVFSVSRGFFAEAFPLVLSAADPAATIRYTLNGSEPSADSPVYEGPIEIAATTILRAATYAPGSVRSRTVTHSYLYLDQVLEQPEPPYDNPDRNNDNDNPPLPTVGDYTFPIEWGTQSGAGFPGEIRNIGSNRAPADYGMDREIIDDPARYNDDGKVDEENGITNLERISRSFRELPLLSVVVDNEQMFGTRGLHWNSTVKGTRYEAACSVELLLPDGTTGFDTTCGIRLHGNASREPRKCPKHGFKLNFKGEFGASKLEYPLFPGSPATGFDDIILRGDFNSSWLHWDGGQQRPRGTRLRDAFCKDTFRDMGRAAGHHRYVHLFINGIYWGTYDATEQENSGFAANTFGGGRDDYDVIEQGQLKSGSATVYNAMRRLRQPVDNAAYETMKTMLDVPWLADYMILHFYLGHEDWGDNVDKNWYAVRHRNGTFRYLPWDMENLMWSERVDRTTVSAPPTGLHTNLDSNDQYLLDFADRAHKHMVAPDGALQPQAMAGRWSKWRAVMQDAIAAESARWGDYRRDVHQHQSGPYKLFTWNGDWIEENNRLLNAYFPVRTGVVLDQLRRRKLYPELNAPEFRDADGALLGSRRVAPGFQLTLSLPDPAPARSRSAGVLYYTTDGSDPRVYYDTTGQRTPSAIEYSGAVTIFDTTTIKARALDGTEWSALMEATFTTGSELPQIRISEIHYNPPGDLGGEALEFLELFNAGTTTVDLGKWSFEGIRFIVPWGTTLGPGARLVIASNAAPNRFASRYPGVAVLGYFGGSLSNSGERIVLLDGEGNGVTAVEYGDAFPWPEGADGGGASLELLDPGGDPQSPANWRASAGNGSPGAANTATLPAVFISEFHTGDGGFVELGNSSGSPVNLSGWRVLTQNPGNAVMLAAGSIVPPGGHFVVATGAATPSALPELLPTQAGEILLADGAGALVDGVRFGPQAAGLSFNRETAASAWLLGTPTPGATISPAATAAQGGLRLNEWLADPAPGFDDWLEVFNADTSLPVVLTGLRIGVNGAFHSIAVPAALAAGGAVQLPADRGSRRGDTLLLKLPAAGARLTLHDSHGDAVDALDYGMQTQDVSAGRLPDGSGDVITLPFASPGAPNHLPAATDPALSEVLVVNIDGDNAPWARRPAWLEVANPAATESNLTGWRLRSIGGKDAGTFTFPPASALPAAGYLRVWCDPGQPASQSSAGALNSALQIDGEYANWGVELLNPAGQVIDRVTWGWQIADQSIGRAADGAWALLAFPTPGAANAPTAGLGDASAAVRLNEWFADSPGSVPARSFIELYNAADAPVALGGFWLSDEPSEAGRRKWQIPELTYLGAGRRVAFVSGSGTARPDRFLFDLNAAGEFVRLGKNDAAATAVQAFSYGYGGGNLSYGQFPDGSGSLLDALRPTPGEANAPAPGPVFAVQPRSQAVPAGQSFELRAESPDAASLQWLHNGEPVPGATEESLRINLASRASEGAYVCAATNAAGTSESRAAVVTVLYTYATWAAGFAVGAAGEDPDGDGISNLREFLGGSSPLTAATPAERAANELQVGRSAGPGAGFLDVDMTLDRRAVFSRLAGEWSATLQPPWSPANPASSEVLARDAAGNDRVRLHFTIPPDDTGNHLRLLVEP